MQGLLIDKFRRCVLSGIGLFHIERQLQILHFNKMP